MYDCTQCSRSFPSRNGRHYHLQTAHRMLSDRRLSESEWTHRQHRHNAQVRLRYYAKNEVLSEGDVSQLRRWKSDHGRLAPPARISPRRSRSPGRSAGRTSGSSLQRRHRGAGSHVSHSKDRRVSAKEPRERNAAPVCRQVLVDHEPVVDVSSQNGVSQRQVMLPSLAVAMESGDQQGTLDTAGANSSPNLSPLLSESETTQALESMEHIAESLVNLPDLSVPVRIAKKPPMLHVRSPDRSSSEEASVSSTSDSEVGNEVDFSKFDDSVSSWPWKSVYSLATKKPDESIQAMWKTVFGVRVPSSDEAEKFSLLIYALRFAHTRSLKSVARLIHELM